MRNIPKIIFCILLFYSLASNIAVAGVRFEAKWRAKDNSSGIATCHDAARTCVESGVRVIEGIQVSKACWKYSYKKTCEFPTRNDCEKLKHCYDIGVKDCLVRDHIGNCVNQKKEFSCKSTNWHEFDRKRVKQELKGDEGKRIVCKGVPCIDGRCVDKSYNMDGDMMESVSQLYAASRMQGGAMGSKLFEGTHDHCNKKPVGYMNCCKIGADGWGEVIGAGCSSDEKALSKRRAKALCEYTGKTTTGKKPFHVNKHHFCCFGNLFNKVFQIEARKQLFKGKSRNRLFGTGDQPDCRGISIDEITNLDFEKMDFSEFANEIKKNIKMPNVADIEARVKDTFTPIEARGKELEEADAPEEHSAIKKAGISDDALKHFEDENDY